MNKTNPGFCVYAGCEHPCPEQLIEPYIARKEVISFGHVEKLIEKRGVI